MKSSVLVIAVTVLTMMSPAPSHALDLVVGVGRTDFSSKAATESAQINVEIHGNPFNRIGRFSLSWAAATASDQEGDFWVGVGLSGLRPLGTRESWFVEASAMPGYYSAGTDGNDLGSNFEARLLLGLGYRVSERTRVSVAIEHKSNASTADHNPGVNSAVLRLGQSF